MKPLKPGENPFIVGSGDKPKPLPNVPAGGRLPEPKDTAGETSKVPLKPNAPRE